MIVGQQTSMRRYTQFVSGKQLPLALGLMEIPASKSALLKAYRRLEFSRRLSFEQVMSDPAYAIGVRNLADAIARRRTSGYAMNGTPTNAKPADDMDTPLAPRTEFHYSAHAKGDR
jgi:hypothetical protein